MLRPLPNNLWTGPTSGRRTHTQVSGTGFRARQLLTKWVGETSAACFNDRVFAALFCSGSVDAEAQPLRGVWMRGRSTLQRKKTKCGSAGSDAKLRQRGLQGAGMTSCSCKRVCVCLWVVLFKEPSVA